MSSGELWHYRAVSQMSLPCPCGGDQPHVLQEAYRGYWLAALGLSPRHWVLVCTACGLRTERRSEDPRTEAAVPSTAGQGYRMITGCGPGTDIPLSHAADAMWRPVCGADIRGAVFSLDSQNGPVGWTANPPAARCTACPAPGKSAIATRSAEYGAPNDPAEVPRLLMRLAGGSKRQQRRA